MKKLRSLVLTTGAILFILGFSSGSYVLKLTETYVNTEIVNLFVLDSFTPNLSLGFLLAFCSLSAGVMLWAYTRAGLPHPPNLVFLLGLIVSLTSAFLSVWLHLKQLRLIESQFDVFGNTPLSIRIINYFSWGSTFVFFVMGIITIFLLWVPHLKEDQISLVSIGQNANTKYLALATVVFLVFALISFIGFCCRMMSTLLWVS
jgi:hypothetical protein